jgi:hypothetical protein
VSNILKSLSCVLSTNIKQNFLSTTEYKLATVPHLIQIESIRTEEKSRVGSIPAALHMKGGIADLELVEHRKSCLSSNSMAKCKCPSSACSPVTSEATNATSLDCLLQWSWEEIELTDAHQRNLWYHKLCRGSRGTDPSSPNALRSAHMCTPCRQTC